MKQIPPNIRETAEKIAAKSWDIHRTGFELQPQAILDLLLAHDEKARELLERVNAVDWYAMTGGGATGKEQKIALQLSRELDAYLNPTPLQKEGRSDSWKCACKLNGIRVTHITGSYCGKCNTYAPGVSP